MAAIAVLLALGPATAQAAVLGSYLALSVLINWPHFTASYHLLYSTPGALRRHPFATLYVPALLVAYVVAAAALYGRAPDFLRVFHAAAAVYLAWHYTGQAWGAMAAFAHAEGIRFDAVSRGLVKANISVLLVWHAVWSANLVAKMLGPARFMPAYEAVSLLAFASAAIGVAGVWRLFRINGRLPASVLLPWASIHLWYGLLYFSGAVYWVLVVQMAHALQYLVFPLRVHENRLARRDGDSSLLKRSAAYYALLLVFGFAAFWAAPHFADWLAARAAVALPAGIAGVLVGDMLAIHHYFVDGCIWKLSNREVRRELFAHLEPS